MAKQEIYSYIKSVFTNKEPLSVRYKHGAQFIFPVYITKKMEEADISELELGVRSYNCLKRAGIDTIADLCERIDGSKDLFQIRNCGSTSVLEIMDALFRYQYESLPIDRREGYLVSVIEKNLND